MAGKQNKVRRHLGLDIEQGAFEGAQGESNSGAHNEGGARTRRPSMRRNRDYSQHMTWTYELNSDLYKCYLEADSSKYKYSTRMKELCDKSHLAGTLKVDIKASHNTGQKNREKRLIYETSLNNTQNTSTQKDDDQQKEENNSVEYQELNTETNGQDSRRQEVNLRDKAEKTEENPDDENLE